MLKQETFVHQLPAPCGHDITSLDSLENGMEDSLTFFSFPMIDQRKIASSNMIERLNKEIRRRTRVVGIFPNEASYMRLVCSYILEYAEDWAYERVYLSPESIRKMMDEPTTDTKGNAA